MKISIIFVVVKQIVSGVISLQAMEVKKKLFAIVVTEKHTPNWQIDCDIVI